MAVDRAVVSGRMFTMNQSPKALWILSTIIFSILSVASQAYSQVVSIGTPSANRDNNQSASQTAYKLDRGINEYGVWVGGSFDSPTVIGTAEDRKFFTIGLRYGRVFGTTKRVAYEYTVDAVPLAIVFQPA